MVRRRRVLKNGAKRRLPSIFGVPCSLFDIPFWLRLAAMGNLWAAFFSYVSGYSLASFLKENFPGTKGDDFFLVIGCDGYRALFSGREIFFTAAGKTFMLVNTIMTNEQ